MKILKINPKKSLDKAFLRHRLLRSEIDNFKTNLITLLDKINIIEKRPKDESEEHLKNDLRDFLRDTYYKHTNAINTKDKKDLVIHLSKTTDSDVAVIIEAKRPTNINEMVSDENPNKKALHELILYYLDERYKIGNIQLKHLIITNVYEWYIIDANYFDKHIYRNTQIKKLYETKINDKKDNPFFYEEIAKIIQRTDAEIPCTYFDIREYDAIIKSNIKEDDRELIALQKNLSPQHLLKIVSQDDTNSLNERFYKELLHIIGLEEAKEGGKNIIRRKKENRNTNSLIELAIEAIQTEDTLHRIPDQTIYGETKEEKTYNIALELCITWINRILFLKLLEGQLITYHKGNNDFRFLNNETIQNFAELFNLFHKVLAVNLKDRTEAIKIKYSRIPYLNSSLFEISELEDQIIKINSLENNGQLELINTSILKDTKKNIVKLPTLEYLFKFLDAYDFASEGKEDIKEDNKTIINASVLGKVFEKINGYKDGSVYTPAFITMYMCNQSIRMAVVKKFNESLSENGKTLFDKFDDVKSYTSKIFKTHEILKANEIINSLRICDPAVGSGHFLVSALNEIIAIKSELGILADENGVVINNIVAEIFQDELRVYFRDTEDNFEYVIPVLKKGNLVKNVDEYNFKSNDRVSFSHRVQKTFFHEKETIIENCLFGVDINPNSVKICRLRLWIELLKNAYYKEETNFLELETLPNIDINIKCGNSLISRFSLNNNGKNNGDLKIIRNLTNKYKEQVSIYKTTKVHSLKRNIEKTIKDVKQAFMDYTKPIDKDYIQIRKITTELISPPIFFSKDEKLQWDMKVMRLSKELSEVQVRYDEKMKTIYHNSFEWRFEFPEVLNENGEFIGFDLIIGNPPYIEHKRLSHISPFLKEKYKVYYSSADISCYFFELGSNILKEKGIVSYISTNKFFKTEYGKPLREFISKNRIYSIVNFEQVPVFDVALVSSLIIIFEKNIEKINSLLYEFYKEASPKENFVYELNKRFQILDKERLSSEAWSFSNSSINELIEKIYSKGQKIKEIKSIDIKRGVTTGFDPAFIISKEKAKELIRLDKKNKGVIKPLLKGAHIKKYLNKASDLFLINTHNGLKNGMSKIDVVKNFKVLLNYFEEVDNLNNKAVRLRTDKGFHWTNLRDCAFLDLFEKEKIVWPLTADKWGFALDTEKHYLSSGGFFLVSEKINLKYILALLNSNLMKFVFGQIGVMTAGGAFTLKKSTIEEFPIVEISEKQQKPFIDLVDKIIVQKQHGKDSTENERKIEEIVYELFNLTVEEIKTIEQL